MGSLTLHSRLRPQALAMAELTPNPFNTLAIETNQHIASYLDNELDLCNFRLICRSTYDAVDQDHLSFWRSRYMSLFEKPTWTECGNLPYKKAYQKRRPALLYGARFYEAVKHREPKEVKNAIRSLETLRDLMIESFSESVDDDVSVIHESKNLEVILRFIVNHGSILECILLPERPSAKDIQCVPKLLLQTVQAMLAPAILSLEYEHSIKSQYSFQESQQVVYGTPSEQQIFGGINSLDVNMEWVLHQINFWKYHMVRKEEHTLYEAFAALADDEKPHFWSRQLKLGGGELGKHWKGSYAYIEREDIEGVRDGIAGDGFVQDEFNGDGTGVFQDLELRMVANENMLWPPKFEKHLRSLAAPTSRARTRAQHRSASPEGIAGFRPINFQFSGDGHDSQEDFCAMGWFNALPPQSGIPGWQRMTMMKYFQDPNTGALDEDALWAHEGVVLPGGQIMVGRWWSASDQAPDDWYCGPFILWCVDGPTYDVSDASDEDEELL